MISLIWGILKKSNTTNVFKKQKQTHRGRKLIYGYQSRKGEWRNKLGIWDQQIKTTMCKIDKHFHISMLWDNPEGLGEEGSGRGIQDGEDTIPVADSC